MKSPALAPILAAIVLPLLCFPLHAQTGLELHFPLDGDPSPGQVYGNAAAVSYVTGAADDALGALKGQAVTFGEGAVIAHNFDLHGSVYPQITITAWLKLDSPETVRRDFFGIGNGQPALIVENGNRVSFKTGRNTTRSNASLPVGEWVMVAAVVDYVARTARIHVGDDVVETTGIEGDTSRIQFPTYPDPEDSAAPRRHYVFIGAHDFGFGRPARDLAIDDVRIYSRALTPEQVQQLRDLQSARPVEVSGGGGDQPDAGRIGEQPPPLDPQDGWTGWREIPGDQFQCDRLPGDQFSCDPLSREELDIRVIPGDQFNARTIPGDQFSCRSLPGDQFACAPTPASTDLRIIPGDQFNPRLLPGDQFECQALPGDQFACISLLTTDIDVRLIPGDQFDPGLIPGDQFQCQRIPGDQFACAESR